MEIVRQVIKNSLIVIVPALVVSLIYFERKVFTGLISGWVLGVVNLRQLSKNIHNLLGAVGARSKIVLLSILRLSILFIVIFLLIYMKLVNPFGLLGGFTVVFLFTIIEGLRLAQRQ